MSLMIIMSFKIFTEQQHKYYTSVLPIEQANTTTQFHGIQVGKHRTKQLKTLSLFNRLCLFILSQIRCLDNSDYGPYEFCETYTSVANMYFYRCSQVLLLFHSDGSNSHKGFKIQFTVQPDSGIQMELQNCALQYFKRL